MMIDVFLDSTPPRRRSSALFEQLREAIVTGRIGPGVRLPTSRELAVDVGVARSTVTTVYSRLIAEGYAEGRPGDGTFATAVSAGRHQLPTSGDEPDLTLLRRDPPIIDRAPPPPRGGWSIDLRTGRPDPGLFPIVEWRRSVTAALQHAPPGYGDAQGLPELRRALAAWIGRSRGVHVSAESILVTSGAQGAFDLCARLTCAPGDIVAVENPGYPPAWRVFEHHRATIAPVPVDDEGIVVAQIPTDSRLVYVTPSHQAPTGAVLSAARRQELLALAADRDMVIVEDDYDTEYRYVDRPLEPLHRLDTTGRVLYVGSFSKTLSPSLRLGFVVAPPAIVSALTAVRLITDTQPPHLTQAALARFILSGQFERHLRRTGRTYRARRDHLLVRLDELRSAGLIADAGSCNAGLHTTIGLHPDTHAEAVAERLRSSGVAIDTTTDLYLGAAAEGLVIGFGLADLAQLEAAIELLAETIQR